MSAERLDHFSHCSLREPKQTDLLDPQANQFIKRFAQWTRWIDLVVSIGQHEQDGQVLDRAGQMRQQGQGPSSAQ